MSSTGELINSSGTWCGTGLQSLERVVGLHLRVYIPGTQIILPNSYLNQGLGVGFFYEDDRGCWRLLQRTPEVGP